MFPTNVAIGSVGQLKLVRRQVLLMSRSETDARTMRVIFPESRNDGTLYIIIRMLAPVFTSLSC